MRAAGSKGEVVINGGCARRHCRTVVRSGWRRILPRGPPSPVNEPKREVAAGCRRDRHRARSVSARSQRHRVRWIAAAASRLLARRQPTRTREFFERVLIEEHPSLRTKLDSVILATVNAGGHRSDWPPSGHCRRGASAPACGRHPVDAREHARHVALVAESRSVRGLCK
jgi:hypothetical protein